MLQKAIHSLLSKFEKLFLQKGAKICNAKFALSTFHSIFLLAMNNKSLPKIRQNISSFLLTKISSNIYDVFVPNLVFPFKLCTLSLHDSFACISTAAENSSLGERTLQMEGLIIGHEWHFGSNYAFSLVFN